MNEESRLPLRRINDSPEQVCLFSYRSGIGGTVRKRLGNAPEAPGRPTPRSSPPARRATDGGRREISKDVFARAHRPARGDNAGRARPRKFASNAQGQGRRVIRG